jgi:hypothetical protein
VDYHVPQTLSYKNPPPKTDCMAEFNCFNSLTPMVAFM